MLTEIAAGIGLALFVGLLYWVAWRLGPEDDPDEMRTRRGPT